VGKLSGGERARLALALITYDAPHLLILDEPTNHLDVDTREALVQALNAYSGAVILISHDRHMVELTADRLVLVDNGTAREYAGSMEDYIDFVLGRNQPKESSGAKAGKGGKAPDKAREAARQIKAELTAAEAVMAKLQQDCAALDAALADPKSVTGWMARLSAAELAQRRAKVATQLDRAEADWLAASEELEALG
jgi:ATP-binding cassette subfamily F protein 3